MLLFRPFLSAKSIYKTHVSTNLFLRKLYIKIVIYLEDIRLMGTSNEELLTDRNTIIYLLQNLGFLSKCSEINLNPTWTLKFLGLLVNSQDMTLSLPTKKKRKIQEWCKEILSQPSVSIRTLSNSSSTTSVLSLATSTIQEMHSKTSWRRKLIFQNRQRGN